MMPFKTFVLHSFLASPTLIRKTPTKTALIVHGLAAAAFIVFVSVV